MSPPALIALTICFVIILGMAFVFLKQNAQLLYIQDYTFHPAIREKLKNKHPLLSDSQLDLVFKGLRDYFYICNVAKGKMVAMPSQIVDDAWHEFILFSREYSLFCKKALGRFLHHIPAEAMLTPTAAQEGIKRAWKLSCVKENIDAKKPEQLPLLFAIDSQLAIADGFIYRLDCTALIAGNDEFCASHIGCGGGSAGCGGGCGGGGG